MAVTTEETSLIAEDVGGGGSGGVSGHEGSESAGLWAIVDWGEESIDWYAIAMMNGGGGGGGDAGPLGRPSLYKGASGGKPGKCGGLVARPRSNQSITEDNRCIGRSPRHCLDSLVGCSHGESLSKTLITGIIEFVRICYYAAGLEGVKSLPRWCH
jgi:hypothetical protein